MTCLARRTTPLQNSGAGLVFDVPTQGFEKRRDEVNARLGLWVGLGEVVFSIRLEFSDELFEVGVEGRAEGFQDVTPITPTLLEASVIPRLAGFKGEVGPCLTVASSYARRKDRGDHRSPVQGSPVQGLL
jgi:hypothetical protein